MAILSLISSLCEQIAAAQDRIEELEKQAERQNGQSKQPGVKEAVRG
jgi:hypothetical protein